MLTKEQRHNMINDATAKAESLENKVSELTDTLDSLTYVLACICRSKGLEPTHYNEKTNKLVNLSVDSEYVAALISEHGEDGLLELLDIR